MKSRHQFIQYSSTALLACGLIASLLSRLAVAALAEERDGDQAPNIVFVYTDDQRWDALGVVQAKQGNKARFPWLKTPNMDRLAQGGVRFRNALVVNAAPSEQPAQKASSDHTPANRKGE